MLRDSQAAEQAMSAVVRIVEEDIRRAFAEEQ